MKITYVWKNCFLKQINIPEAWINRDAFMADPIRQDLFWVECNKDEIHEQVIPLMTDPEHKVKMLEAIDGQPSPTFHFMISRQLDYIQFYPYFSMNGQGSLWEKTADTTFNALGNLKNFIE